MEKKCTFPLWSHYDTRSWVAVFDHTVDSWPVGPYQFQKEHCDLCRQRSSENVAQKLVLGTHTSNGEQNYLMIASIKLPDLDMDMTKGIHISTYSGIGSYLCHSLQKSSARQAWNLHKDKPSRWGESVSSTVQTLCKLLSVALGACLRILLFWPPWSHQHQFNILLWS